MITARQLLEQLGVALPAACDGSTPITALAVDSRDVAPGACFAAFSDNAEIRRRHIEQAFSLGAVLVLSCGERANSHKLQNTVHVADLACRIDDLLHWFYGSAEDWQKGMKLLAITGTHGKTSVAGYVCQLLETVPMPAISIGTLGINANFSHRDQNNWHPTGITTPTLRQMPLYLAKCKSAGAKVLCIEVSSQAIAEDRIKGLKFAAVGITSLGSEHLDFHGTLEDYHKTKCDFIGNANASGRLVSLSAPGLCRLVSRLKSEQNSVSAYLPHTYSDCNWQQAGLADYTSTLRYIPQPLDTGQGRLSVQIQADQTSWNTRCSASTEFQLENLCFAACLLETAGFAGFEAFSRKRQLGQVCGRFQEVAEGVFVDFAHTPESVETVLRTLSVSYPNSQIVAVIGCGGDRDSSKRRPMLDSCLRYAATVIITEDNARSEPQQQIFADMTMGLSQTDLSKVVEISDRKEAVMRAHELHKANHKTSLVAILGRGHETLLHRNQGQVELSDIDLAKSLWNKA